MFQKRIGNLVSEIETSSIYRDPHHEICGMRLPTKVASLLQKKHSMKSYILGCYLYITTLKLVGIQVIV